MTHSFDRPPAGLTRSGRPRVIGLDVARAIALIGVVVMNYHGIMNFSDWSERSESFVGRIFDISTGALSTRFAATFVVVAGVGITLLTNSARASSSRQDIVEARVRLVRRGFVLLIGGYFLDLAWPGTILFYYGAYFVGAAFVFNLRTRRLAIIAGAIVAGTLTVSIWRRDRLMHDDPTAWIDPAHIESARDVFARAFLGYTHPILPWFSFLVAGMILGRHLDTVHRHRRKISLALIATIVTTYAAATIVRSFTTSDQTIVYIVSSMQPYERGFAYIVSTLAIAVLAVIAISTLAEHHAMNALIVAFRRAGQLSLSLYLGHVLFYYAVVDWFGWWTGTGLGSALGLSATYWILGITAAPWWHHRLGPGPAEWLYRRLSG